MGSDPNSGGRRATINDVASVAGVSRSTASRALTGKGYVAAAARARVLAAAKKVHYVPDATAQNLKQQSSKTIGVIVSDLRNSFYAELAAGVARAARKAGYGMLLVDADSSTDQEIEAAKTFLASRVAGAILASVSPETVPYLALHGIPSVEADRQFAAGKCDAVVVDNRSGARSATEHLLSQDHTRIAFLIDEQGWTTGSERFEGHKEALVNAGLEADRDMVVKCGWSATAAQTAIADILQTEEPPTAIFAVNNVLAEGTYRAVREAGLSIPEDVSIVSFDDVPWMSMVAPGLTTVTQDPAGIGEAAVERLLGRIDEPEQPFRLTVLPAELVIRGSTGPRSRRTRDRDQTATTLGHASVSK